METRVVTTEYLLALWEGAISLTFFPEILFDRLQPLDILNAWGDELPAVREKYRPQVDEFIERLLDIEEPETLWKALFEIDPTIMALYCDRLNTATAVLKMMREEKKAVEIAASWPTTVASLLFQMSPQ